MKCKSRQVRVNWKLMDLILNCTLLLETAERPGSSLPMEIKAIAWALHTMGLLVNVKTPFQGLLFCSHLYEMLRERVYYYPDTPHVPIYHVHIDLHPEEVHTCTPFWSTGGCNVSLPCVILGFL